MNNNILRLWADSQTFTSQVLWMLRLQFAPAEQLPAVEELCGGDKLSSTGRRGCLALWIHVCRCTVLIAVSSESFCCKSGKRCSEGHDMSQVRRAISRRKRFRARQPWLRSPLSHLFFPFSSLLSLGRYCLSPHFHSNKSIKITIWPLRSLMGRPSVCTVVLLLTYFCKAGIFSTKN